MNLISRPGLMGSRSSIFTVLPIWMGQATPALMDRAQVAVNEYEGLLARLGGVKDDAERARIGEWLGSDKVPGSPSERYSTVARDIGGMQDPAVFEKRISDLEAVNLQLRPMVAQAEASKGTVTGSNVEQVTQDSGALSGRGIAMAAIAITSFLVAPFVLD